MANPYIEELFGLQGQTAIVIGGTGVLGGSICDGLAQAGAQVVVSGRSAERGNARVQAIEENGGNAQFVAADASSLESLQQLRETVVNQLGQVNILVNCAGVNSATPYEEITEEEWDKVIDGNLKATHFGCQVFAPQMASQDQGGAILNIGSVTSHLPLSKVFAYSASKAAVVNLTQNLAREYAPQGVRINALSPAFSRPNRIERF